MKYLICLIYKKNKNKNKIAEVYHFYFLALLIFVFCTVGDDIQRNGYCGGSDRVDPSKDGDPS